MDTSPYLLLPLMSFVKPLQPSDPLVENLILYLQLDLSLGMCITWFLQ